MSAAANDPGERGGSRAAEWLLAPPSCGDQLPARVPRAAPRRSSLRFPLSLPGSFASLAMVAPTASCAPAGPLPAIGLEHPVLPRGAALEDGALLGVGEDVEVLALDAAHDAACDLLGADDAAHHGGALGDGRLARVAQRRGPVADRVLVDLGLDDHRAEDADADAVLGELAVEGLAQPHHGELGGAVHAEPAHPDQPRHGGRVDDVPGGADPAAAAGDDGDPSLEVVHSRQAYSAPRPVTSAGQGAAGDATRTA